MKQLLLSLFCLLCCSVYSHNYVIQGLAYSLNSEDMTASVVSCKIPGIDNWDIDSMSLEIVVVPKSISIGDATYRVTSIGNNAFENCPGLISVELPSSLKEIGKYAFQGCVNLNSINIPKSVEVLGEGCFMACENMREVKLPANLLRLQSGTFAYCSVLNNVVLPESLLEIGKMAFLACSNLRKITLNEGIEKIGYSAFAECGFRSLTIPSTVSVISRKAFYNCQSLDSIVLPSSLATLGDSVFHDCANLKRVSLTGCQAYGSEFDGRIFFKRNEGTYNTILFYNRQADVCVIPDSFDIAPGVFRNNRKLTKVILPSTLKTIGDFAFEGCTALRDIVIPKKIEYIGEGAFLGCSSLKAFNVFHGENYFTSDNGKALFHQKKGGVEMICYTDSVATVFIPSYVTDLGCALFSGHDEITNIFIPDAVKTIGPLAFLHCSNLRSITLPDGIVKIGNQTFDSCASLDQIVLPRSVTEIGDNVFCNCAKLSLLVLPEGLVDVGNYLFVGCNPANLKIVSLSSTPAVSRINTFKGVETVELHVPTGSVDKYRNHISWGKVRNIVDDL